MTTKKLHHWCSFFVFNGTAATVMDAPLQQAKDPTPAVAPRTFAPALWPHYDGEPSNRFGQFMFELGLDPRLKASHGLALSLGSIILPHYR